MPRNSFTSTSSARSSALGLLAAAALPLLALGCVNFYADPFQQYREPVRFAPRFWHTLQRYITPGFAKRGDYSVAIVGSSMFESFRNSEASRLLGGKAANLSLSGASAFEEGLLIDLAFRQAKVRRVIVDLNVNTYAGPPDKRWFSEPLPLYLWDSNPFNDVRYLLSLDTLERSRDLLQSRGGGPRYFSDPDMPWSWARTLPFGGKQIFYNDDPADLNRRYSQPPRTVAEMTANFDANILPRIRAHPEARFDLVHPPYSILAWADFHQRKQLEVTLEWKRQLFERVKALPNAAIHDFQNAAITDDLDQYKDIYHFGIPAAQWMLEQLGSGAYRVDAGNLTGMLERLRARAVGADARKLIEAYR